MSDENDFDGIKPHRDTISNYYYRKRVLEIKRHNKLSKNGGNKLITKDELFAGIETSLTRVEFVLYAKAVLDQILHAKTDEILQHYIAEFTEVYNDIIKYIGNGAEREMEK